MGLLDWLGFGNSADSKGGGFSLQGLLSAAAPIALQGGLQYLGNESKLEQEQSALDQSLLFKQTESQKDRDAQLELLKLKLAADAAGGGGGGGGSGAALAIARLNAQMNALGNAQTTTLQGGEQTTGAIARMLAAIQNGLRG